MAEARFEVEPAALAALDAVVVQPWAWTSLALLVAQGHDPGVLGGLIDEGWLRRWELPDDVVVTLSPWCARKFWLEIVELGLAERPRWGRRAITQRMLARGVTGPPVYLPSYARLQTEAEMVVIQKYELELKLPELVVDPAPGPEYLAELGTGEVTKDASKAMRLWARDGGDVPEAEKDLAGGLGKPGAETKAGAGVPVPIDPRLKKQRHQEKKRKGKLAEKRARR